MIDTESHSEIPEQPEKILKKEFVAILDKLLLKSDGDFSNEVFYPFLLKQLDPAFAAATEGDHLILGFDILNHDEQLTGLGAVTDALSKHLRPKSYSPPSRLITPIIRRYQRVSATPYREMAPTTIEATKASADGIIEINGQRFVFSPENALYRVSSVVSSDDGAGPGKASAAYTLNTLSNEIASEVSNPEYADMLFIDPTKSDLENMITLAKRLEVLRASDNA